MIWGFLSVGILQLLVFQANCFPPKTAGPPGLPTVCLRKCTHNEANLTPTYFDDGHQFLEPLRSKSKRSFIEQPRMYSDIVGSRMSPEIPLSKELPAKRKRVDNLERVSKSSRISKESRSGHNSSDSNIRHPTGIDLNRLPSETEEECFSDNVLGMIWSKSGSICVAPGVMSPQKEKWSKVNQRQSRNSIIVDNAHNTMLTENASPSKSQLEDDQFIIKPQDKTNQVATKESMTTGKAVSPQIDSSDNVHVEEDLGLSSKPSSGNRRFFAVDVFRHVANSHLTLDLKDAINDWFDELKVDMYHKNKGSLNRTKIDKIIKRARKDITIPFLGCLHVFEYKKPQWPAMSKLQKHGWEFMKKLFDPWRAIDLNKIDNEEVKELDVQRYWYNNPMSDIKSLLDVNVSIKLPNTLFVELHMLWTNKSTKPDQEPMIREEHREFFRTMKGLDWENVQQFYKIACMNCQGFQSYILKKADTKQVPTSTLSSFSERITITGEENAPPILKEDLETYLSRLSHVLSGNLDIDYAQEGFSYDSQEKAQTLRKIKQTINCARRVTFAFLGSLVKIYEGRLQQEMLEEVLQDGWRFLKEQFSTWITYDFRPSQRKTKTDLVTLKPVTKSSVETPLEIFHYLLTRQSGRTPMHFVHALVNWWIHDLSSQEQAGKNLSFQIPSPIKDRLGYALKDPKDLFSKNRETEGSEI